MNHIFKKNFATLCILICIIVLYIIIIKYYTHTATYEHVGSQNASAQNGISQLIPSLNFNTSTDNSPFPKDSSLSTSYKSVHSDSDSGFKVVTEQSDYSLNTPTTTLQPGQAAQSGQAAQTGQATLSGANLASITSTSAPIDFIPTTPASMDNLMVYGTTNTTTTYAPVTSKNT